MESSGQDGMLSNILNTMGIGKLSTMPTVTQKGFEMVITQAELSVGITNGIDPKIRQYVTVELHEGKMVVRVKL
jgi:hypothetical protein